MDNDMRHMDYLQRVANEDVKELEHKEKTYQGSWKRRGGIGAAMMILRKVDRLEIILQACHYDIFQAIGDFPTGMDGSALAEVRDLRRYLLLVEAEIQAREARLTTMVDTHVEAMGSPADGGHHTRQYTVEVAWDKSNEPVKVLERLEDGLKTIPREHEDWYMTSVSNGAGYHIVNRNKVDTELWEHLPRLKTELNDKEYRETLPEYHSLFAWNEADSKWQMRWLYLERWGKS